MLGDISGNIFFVIEMINYLILFDCILQYIICVVSDKLEQIRRCCCFSAAAEVKEHQ